MNTQQHTQHDGEAFAVIAVREYFTRDGYTVSSGRVFYAGSVWAIPTTNEHGYAWAVRVAREAIGNPAAVVAVDATTVTRRKDLHANPAAYGLPNPTATGYRD